MKGKRLACASLLLLAAGASLAAWAFVYEPSRFAVRRYEIPLSHPSWRDRSLSIALLSDVHAGSPFYGLDRIASVVEAVCEAEPDLVLLAGDYVIDGVLGGDFVPPEDTARALSGLRAPLGVYAVLGNHDHWYDAPRVRKAFEDVGIPVLQDEAVRLRFHRDEGGPAGREDGVWLVGLGDLWEASPDLDRALAPVDDDAPVVAFTHNPDVFPQIPDRVALTLAGHTHGGQVRLPLLGTPVVPSRYGSRYVHGLVVEEGRALFVTSGLGTSILPVRFRVPPEVALLTLRGDVRATERETETRASSPQEAPLRSAPEQW